ncbi:hypothetical protein DAH55_10990 [Sphingomonas koreensis]|uniref:hypothetical protein n=1 Tax=Sphingomonas koreensis TaxID=93064 RepID=UPI000831F372|nr:hypothetical protein [Sphingomonas koreensis]RSU59617.1 hypothetical protein DAH56_11615 [Sphingomonas koreensis]RSU68771.1 hypothetical protein DAH55_10990 [Sphingomonas koreensis]
MNPLSHSKDIGAERAASRTTGPHHFASQNRDPHRRWRGRFAVLDPARSTPGDGFIFRKMMEAGMSIEQQIEELRAELKACCDRRESQQIATELQAALEERERRKAGLETEM